MEAESKVRLIDLFVGLRDQKQVDHNLVELLIVGLCAVLGGADDFV